MTVCQSRDSCPQLSQLSQEGLLMVQVAEYAPSRVCTLSHHARFLWTRVSVVTLDAVIGKRRPNTIVAIPIERDDFVQKYLSCLIVQV